MAAEKLKILELFGTRDFTMQGKPMISYRVRVQWGSTQGPVEEGEFLAKPGGSKYAAGDILEATKSVDAQGRIKFKKVTPQGFGGGGGGAPGGGPSANGGARVGFRGRPAAEIPYEDAIELYKQICADLGVVPHAESATSIMIAIYSGDVLRPGQKPVTAPQGQPSAASQVSRPGAAPPPPQGSLADGWS